MMLAKFITLCICALLRTNNAAAQLDFGVYKITNRASQSSLCSHEVGGPIYVSMQGHSCARDLWELTPGYEHGLYTITNIGLNSSIRASNTLGAHVIPSNDKTLFAISSNEGHGHIIKYPNIDLVWTVVPTVMSRGDVSPTTLARIAIYMVL
ncbi:hypothetical protein PILCRDRAFT_254128 [Piloderma croceum F 1598]|uniref:Ricin B lectin domain-containing protein n=1 Tax=Piloderma croceum (strain F 1598) TaxID=765440 RepID=A0A0C3GCG6_PILCF|nr:hypothetical protein PILCRDRAFT_254128 [Piloderma croceum F 1598]